MNIFNSIYNIALNEGLIKTQDILKTKDIINKSFKNVKVITDLDDNIVAIEFSPFLFKPDEIERLFKLVNNLGWFPAIYHTNLTRGMVKYIDDASFLSAIKKADRVGVKLEPKFDPEYNKQTIYYHVTKQSYIPKIEKVGLIPKTQSKISYHPERIYLATSLNYALDILEQLYAFNDSIPLWVIYQVNTEKIPNFKTMKDPNFIGGVYTTQNIPPSALKIIKKFNMSLN